MSNCVFDLLIGGKRHMSSPWIYGESSPESLQKGVVLWAGILLWRDEGSRKPCICNCIVEREKSSSSANAPEYDCPGDRMDPLGKGDQAGNTCNYQRHQANRHQHSEHDDYFSRARTLDCGIGLHGGGNTVHPRQQASIETSLAALARLTRDVRI